MTEDQFRVANAEFVGAFEVVFRYDWDYAKVMIGDEAENASFTQPGLEGEDWGARCAFAEKYVAVGRELLDRVLLTSHREAVAWHDDHAFGVAQDERGVIGGAALDQPLLRRALF